MSMEAVRKHLKKYGLDKRIREFKESTATVEEAAKVNSCEPARIAKSLSFIINDVPTIIVVAGDAKINNQKFKAKFKTKATMIAGSDVENLIGHPVGGVCPFGIKDSIKVYLDESMKRFESMLPACGTPNSAIELTLEELEKAKEELQKVYLDGKYDVSDILKLTKEDLWLCRSALSEYDLEDREIYLVYWYYTPDQDTVKFLIAVILYNGN